MKNKELLKFIEVLILVLVFSGFAVNINNQGTIILANDVQIVNDAYPTTLISISSNGLQGNGVSRSVSISRDGSFIVFSSEADNLVEGDTNGKSDMFVRDWTTNQTKIVSISSDGTQANDNTFDASISDDGRFVVFGTVASNLTSGDTNGFSDIFIHDLETGITECVSVASDGTMGNGHSVNPFISGDGRYIVFNSRASNLVTDDDNDDVFDVFFHDRQTGETELVSVSSDGTQGNYHSTDPVITPDGRYVAFVSEATNLVEGGTNAFVEHFYVHDRQTGETELVSVSSDGIQGNNDDIFPEKPAISSNGRFIAFSSQANNLVDGDTNNFCDNDYDGVYDENCSDIFVHDRLMKQTTRVSVATDGTQANEFSCNPQISSDGRYVVFASDAINLIENDANESRDVFIHDRQTGETSLVSIGNSDLQGNGGSYLPIISSDSGFIAFSSSASNLVEGDSNEVIDVFLRYPLFNDQRAWTIMYYQAWDNELDGHLNPEINTIKSASNNPNIYIPVFRDYHNQGSVYEAYVNGQIVANISKDELNTGNSQTLSDFITWSKSNYPANHYALVIVDHGHGLSGTSKDLTDTDWLDPQEFRIAIQTSGPFDVIFLDACLVANLEHAYQARGETMYYVASEALVIAPLNHHYLNQISSLTSARELAESMAVAYDDEWNVDGESRTISVGDMSKIEQVAQSTNGLASAIRSHRVDLGIAIWGIITGNIVQRFETDNGDGIIDENDILADLYHFAQLIGGLGESDLTTAANNLITAIDEYIVYNSAWSKGSWYHDNAHGLSIILTKDPACYYTSNWFDFAGSVSWFCDQDKQIIEQENGEWGQMLSDLIVDNNPDPQPQFEPPPLVPLDVYSNEIYLPLLVK